MNTICTIAWHDILRLFKTGKFLRLLALCQFILGIIFYWLMEEFLSKSQQQLLEKQSPFGITEEVIHPLFAWTILLFFFLSPLLASYSITQEKRTRVLDLFLLSPISSKQIILGKYLGLFASLLSLLLPTIMMCLSLTLYNRIDFGHFLSGLLGVVLVLMSSLSLSLFVAMLSKEPLVSVLTTFVTLCIFSLSEWITRFISSFSLLQVFTELSPLYHAKNLLSGCMDTQDISYFVLSSFIFIALTIWRLNREPLLKSAA